MMKRSILAMLVCAAAASPAFGGGVVVAQVEALAGSTYAPVNFAGAYSVTESSGDFAGIKFFAESGLAGSGSDQSEHARAVGDEIYGLNSPAHAYVTSVRAIESNDLLGVILSPPTLRRTSKAPPPGHLPGGAKVLNGSFAGSTGWNSTDKDLLARMDLLIARDGVVGRGRGGYGHDGQLRRGEPDLGREERDRGAREQPADAVRPVGQRCGAKVRRRVGRGARLGRDGGGLRDGRDAGGQAQAAKRQDLAKPAMVRALLMAGADRAALAGSDAWAPDRANGLDTGLGAGRANLAGAQALAASPAATFLTAGHSTLKLKATPAVQSSGAGNTTIKPSATFVSIFTLGGSEKSVTATLAWDTAQRNDSAGDLKIELIPISFNKKGAAVLSAAPLITMDSPGDNVRFVTSDLDFAAGMYAWVIKNTGKETLSPALVYDFGEGAGVQTTGEIAIDDPTGLDVPARAGIAVVPEPGNVAWLAVTPIALRRARRR